MRNDTKSLLTLVAFSLLMFITFSSSIVLAEENEQLLNFGEKVTGDINAENTSDHYVIKLEESGSLKIDLSSFIDYGVNVTLEDENGEEVMDANVQGGKPTDPKKWGGSQYLEPGTYYLKINKYITYTGTYELEVNMIETNNTESEPNDGNVQATETELNKKITGLISWNDSIDAFKVTLDTPSLLSIDFASYIDNSDYSSLTGVYLSLEDENGTPVIDEKVGGGELADPTKWGGSQYLEPGTYYLKVSKYYGSTGKYDFEIDVEEINGNESEPNNGTGQAIEVEKNQKISGLLSWNDSLDTYKVTLEKAGLLNVNFSSYIDNNEFSSLTGVYFSLEDENGTNVINEKIDGGEPANPTKWNGSQYLEPGTYYLKMSKYYGSTGKYDFEINVEETNNTEMEPNNGTEQAQQLLTNKKVTGLISWNDELDTYEFTMENSGDIELNFSSFIDYAVSLKLVDENGDVLYGDSIRNGNPVSPKIMAETINLEAGTYYLHVNREYGMTGKYELAVNTKVGWVQDDGNWYYYTSKGKQTGWLQDGSSWYYLDSEGVMKTGWIEQDGHWYYLYSSGIMATDWTKSGGHWYYMNAGGVMQTGWLKDDGKWYLLKSSGAMATGWTRSGGAWYYMASSGIMQTGWLKAGTQWYYLTGSGAMATGWVLVSGEWYYMYSDGTMASNTTIDGYKIGFNGTLY
jgi:cell wall-associated protease